MAPDCHCVHTLMEGPVNAHVVTQSLTHTGCDHCDHRYTDLAAHPLAVLLPYSVHSYGVVQAYAMGVPLLVPSQRLLGQWHRSMALLGHKGPGNVPWRRSLERARVPFDGWAWLAHDQHAWFTAPVNSAQSPSDGCMYAAR